MAYEKELELALLAVQRAAILTKSVYSSHSKGTLTKTDSSPVTIGDFGAQALIIASIKSAFPDDEVVGEEDADDLRSNADLKNLVWDLVQQAKLSDPASEEKIGGPIKSADDMLTALDSGASEGGNKDASGPSTPSTAQRASCAAASTLSVSRSWSMACLPSASLAAQTCLSTTRHRWTARSAPTPTTRRARACSSAQ